MGLLIAPFPGISTAAITYLAVAMKGGSFADVVRMVEGVRNYPVLWTCDKFIMALPVCYHLINGMRHLVSCVVAPVLVWLHNLTLCRTGTWAMDLT